MDGNNIKLNIWIIREGEALPVDEDARLMRAGRLAEYLSEQGHTVTWWSSTFIHGTKSYYCSGYKEIAVNDHETLILLHSSRCYKKNTSFDRIRYNRVLGKEFDKNSHGKEKPDVIVCCWPIPEFAKAAVRYGEENDVPVIIDARDMWPDIYKRALPKVMQRSAEIALIPFKHSAGKIFSKAYGITAMVPPMLKWACRYAGRKPGERDRTIFIGSERLQASEVEIEEIKKQWSRIDEKWWNVCFIGSLSASAIDADTVIEAIKLLSSEYPEIHFLIGGDGDAREKLEKQASGCPNIHFFGWVNHSQMQYLMQISKCGVLCYRNLEDFKNGFGNKIFQYMSASLPIINSAQGYAKYFLKKYNAGLTYKEGNAEDCARKIEMLYKDEKMRAELAQNALAQFERKFEKNIVNQQFENYICRIAGMYKEEKKKH